MKRPNPPFEPVLVTSKGDLAKTMAARRVALGLTIEELDHKAGLQERYSGKLEHPEQRWGRGALQLHGPSVGAPAGDVQLLPMGDFALQALGLRLLLVTEEQAAALNPVEAPPRLSPPERRAAMAKAREALANAG